MNEYFDQQSREQGMATAQLMFLGQDPEIALCVAAFIRRDISEDLGEGIANLEAAIALLEKPGQLYERAGDEERRLINQALFSKILVIEEEVTDVEFNEPFAELVALNALPTRQQRAP